MRFFESLAKRRRMIANVALVLVVLLATWAGAASGGYFVDVWTPIAFVLAALLVLVAASADGAGVERSRYGIVAVGIFGLYAVWAFLSLLWSPNRGEAWVGAGQTLMYVVAFWLALYLISLGASRRWALIASALGPAVVAASTVPRLVPSFENMFDNDRLIGTVGYYNGEAGFLLAPFWVAVYLAGSRRMNPVVRGLVLAGAVLCVEVAVLAQSRGAILALILSLPVFFLFSGKRLRGLLALAPVVVALLVAFPGLNEVYVESRNQGSPIAALGRILPVVSTTTILAGLYGLSWGLVDLRWRPPATVTRIAGYAALAACAICFVVALSVASARVGNLAAWGGEQWEAFRADDVSGREQSRYLNASGSGRYTLWQVAGEDFESSPLIGIGTHNYEATYYQTRERVVGYVRQPHNLPLEILAERGIVGGFLFFGFLATCLAAAARRGLLRLNSEGRAMTGAMLAALAYWFVHSSAEWFWQIPAVTLPAMVYLAALVAPWERPANPSPPARQPRIAGAAVAVMLVATVVVPLYFSDRYLEQASETAENPWVALEAIERAQTFDPVNSELPLREAELAEQIGDLPRARDAYERSIEMNPEHYAPHVFLARFYERLGAPDRALSSYRNALELNPLERELRQRVAELEAATENAGDGGG